MAVTAEALFRDQLLERRRRLHAVKGAGPAPKEVPRLLREVDAALERLEHGSFGICETCHEPIETERLVSDPLSRFCLDHLTEPEQRALEKDIDLASRIQGALLPRRSMAASGWEASYHYEGAGPVSGDYCDLAELQGRLHFAVGDVTGKGVAASMLMTHLHATLRALLSPEVPLDQLLERVNRGFCESTLPTHYATLVCGRAGGDGEIEICNAGHLPPLLLRGGEAEWIGPTGLPVGISGDARFGVTSVRLRPGDALVLYTDGLTEAPDPSGAEYGRERLRERLSIFASRKPQDLLAACLEDLASFRRGASKSDDLTLMAIGRSA